MAKITVEIKGPSRGAYVFWEAKSKAMSKSGSTYTATFTATSREKPYTYVLNVFGAPGEKWTATIDGGEFPSEHSGTMNGDGFDDSGSTPYQV